MDDSLKYEHMNTTGTQNMENNGHATLVTLTVHFKYKTSQEIPVKERENTPRALVCSLLWHCQGKDWFFWGLPMLLQPYF